MRTRFVHLAILFLWMYCASGAFAQSASPKWNMQFTDFSTPLRLLGPDKILQISQDSVWVYKPTFGYNRDGRFKRTQDALVYATKHQINITPLMAAIDSLESGYFNLCIHGGLMFRFRMNDSGFLRETSIGNYYHPQIFAILDAIKPYLPERYHIRYDREAMEKKLMECEKYFQQE